jgi:hypothetical protein
MVKRDHATMTSDTLSTMQKDPSVHSIPLTKKWVQIVAVPSEEEEMQFHLQNDTTANWSSPCMGFWVTAPDPSTSCPVQFEAYCHFEAIGQPIQNYRQSIVDPIGAAAVLNAIKRRGAQPVLHETPWQLAKSAASEIGGMSAVVR